MKRYKLTWTDLEQENLDLLEDEDGNYTDYDTASELLDALKLAEVELNSLISGGNYNETLGEVRAAIAKAER